MCVVEPEAAAVGERDELVIETSSGLHCSHPGGRHHGNSCHGDPGSVSDDGEFSGGAAPAH